MEKLNIFLIFLKHNKWIGKSIKKKGVNEEFCLVKRGGMIM
jgi:hypothetical protein